MIRLAGLVGFTNEVKLTVIVLALLCVGTLALYAYAISVFFKNDLLRILGIVSAGMVMLSYEIGLYVQGTPHRTFSYAIFTALIACWYAHPRRRTLICVAGYVVGTLTVVWSAECGVIVLLGWAALHCCRALQEGRAWNWLRTVLHVVLVAVCFAAGYGLTNMFNLALGGRSIPFKQFLFPLLTDSHMEGFLEEPLYGGPAAWMSIALTLFLFICRGLSDTVLCTGRPRKDARAPALFALGALGALGVGTLAYAFSRPAYGNFYIMMPTMALCMAIIVQSALPECIAALRAASRRALPFWSTLRGSVGIITLCVLFLTNVMCVANYGSRQDRNLRFKDEYSMRCLSEAVLNQLPQDIETAAMGRGAQELYAASGLDTGVYVMDHSDITIDPNHLAHADECLAGLEGKALLICADIMKLHEESGLDGYRVFMETHDLAGPIVPPSGVGDTIFLYYVPSGYDFSTEQIVLVTG